VQLRWANAQVGAAVVAMLLFTITGSAGGNATQMPRMFRSGGAFWNIVGDVSQPISERGTLLYRKRAASATVKQASTQIQNTVIAAYQKLVDTPRAAISDADALALDVDAKNATKVTYDLTRR